MLSIIYLAALIAGSSPNDAFCERLAAAIKMKTTYDEEGHKTYSRSMYHLKDFLIGGSEAVTMGIDAPDDVTLEQFKLIRNACDVDGKGRASCNVAGPLTFVMTIDGVKQRIEARNGEIAGVRVVAPHVYCEEAGNLP